MAVYTPKLSNEVESIFSDHYMIENYEKLDLCFHKLIPDHQKKILEKREFNEFIDCVKRASERHIHWSYQRIFSKIIVQCNEATTDKLMIAVQTLLKDRQFTKGSNNNIDWSKIFFQIRGAIENNRDIECVIVGLPFKMPSLLKCESAKADFGEAGFILQLYEFCKVAELIFQNLNYWNWNKKVLFRVVMDGKRFQQLIGITDHEMDEYKNTLENWISLLDISEYIKLDDYEDMINTSLDFDLKAKKTMIKKSVKREYLDKLPADITLENLNFKLEEAKYLDPDPEKSNKYGRFVSLFQSILFTMRYDSIEEKYFTDDLIKNEVYIKCIECIILKLSHENDLAFAKARAQSLLALCGDILKEAWDATIDYISEIRSDRDLSIDIIQHCHPNSLRWTIHDKKGQICIASKKMYGINLFPWHGVSLIKESRSKLNQYTVPSRMLQDNNLTKLSVEINDVTLPICYVQLKSLNFASSIEAISKHYSRRVNG